MPTATFWPSFGFAMSESGRGAGIRRLFVRRVAPGGLLALAFGTALLAGQGWFRQALAFALCILLAVGGHAFGHFVVARRYGVDASFPYFVPQVSLSGTGGAYVKLRWPIDDRAVLVRIFAAGPIAGFLVSVPMLFVGLALSDAAPRSGEMLIELGDSLVALAAQRIMFPDLSERETVLAHPIYFAGAVGLNFGLWQLLPVGRFDGGRVVYAFLGRKRATVVSWVTIAGLVALSFLSSLWFGFAVFGALSLIGLKRQHPIERHTQGLNATAKALGAAMLAIFVLTFVPVLARPLPLGNGVEAKKLDTVLEDLSSIVARLGADKRFVAIQRRVADTLDRNSGAPQAWEPLPLELFESGLPDGIRSCWVFRLRAGGTFGAERHPNSHQRSVALAGTATFEVFDGGTWVEKQLGTETLEPLRDSWISIPPGQWHRIRIGPSDFTSCSFHTAMAEELVEETPLGDDLTVTHKRLYGDTSHP
jgi:hypothetical protein